MWLSSSNDSPSPFLLPRLPMIQLILSLSFSLSVTFFFFICLRLSSVLALYRVRLRTPTTNRRSFKYFRKESILRKYRGRRMCASCARACVEPASDNGGVVSVVVSMEKERGWKRWKAEKAGHKIRVHGCIYRVAGPRGYRDRCFVGWGMRMRRSRGMAGSLSRVQSCCQLFSPEGQIYNFVSLEKFEEDRGKSQRNGRFAIGFSRRQIDAVQRIYGYIRTVCSISTIPLDTICLDPLLREILTKFLLFRYLVNFQLRAVVIRKFLRRHTYTLF